MKKIVFALIFSHFTFFLSAQSLCGLKIEKGKEVNYYYLNFQGIDTLIVYKTMHKWPVPDEVDFDAHFKNISEGISDEDFEYDHQNDTILFVADFNRLRFYTKNHCFKFYYDTLISNEVREADYELSRATKECDFAIYNGDMDKVKKLIESQGYVFTLGAGCAIRLIIKDGMIQYPIDLWRYYFIQ